MAIKVYIAGPYTKPDPVANTHRAIEMANVLAERGFVPYVPHLTLFWHFHSPKPYLWWLEYDLNWLDACDVILRLSGESRGADGEVDHAKLLGKPVFTDLDSLCEWEREQSCRS